MRPSLRVLHCADLHLDVYHRERALRIVRSLATMESSLGADVVLIAGDVFDRTREPEEFVDEVAECFIAFHAPIVAIPGNHDVPFNGFDPTGRLFSLVGERGLYLSSIDGQSVEVADGRLRVWGRGMPEHSPANDPLANFRPMDSDGHWNVVLAHGELLSPGKIASFSSAIRLGDYGPKLGSVHYMALGHAHGPTQRALGRTIMRDSGAATSIGGTGTATLVDFTGESGLSIVSYLVEQ